MPVALGRDGAFHPDGREECAGRDLLDHFAVYDDDHRRLRQEEAISHADDPPKNRIRPRRSIPPPRPDANSSAGPLRPVNLERSARFSSGPARMCYILIFGEGDIVRKAPGPTLHSLVVGAITKRTHFRVPGFLRNEPIFESRAFCETNPFSSPGLSAKRTHFRVPGFLRNEPIFESRAFCETNPFSSPGLSAKRTHFRVPGFLRNEPIFESRAFCETNPFSRPRLSAKRTQL